MKKIAGFATVIALLGAMTWSGSALGAENERAKAPQAGTWEYQVALETGKLPAEGQAAVKSASAAQVQTIEVGGRTYRVGIDTK